MKRELLVGIALGGAVVALISGAPVASLLYGLLILACPLMMLFMMRGMHAGDTKVPPPTPNDDRASR